MNFSTDSIDQIVSKLLQRISLLEIQYQQFVKYCIEMIHSHRAALDFELKNDPNTPRELAQHIMLKSEELEKNVKLASGKIKKSKKQLSDIQSFRSEFIIANSREEIINLFDKLEDYIGSNYVKKLGKKRIESKERESLKILKEENQKLSQISDDLQMKVLVLQRELAEKDEKVKEVLNSLDKIKKMQDINTKNINIHCSSLNNSKGSTEVKISDSGLDSNIFSQGKFEESFYYSAKNKLLEINGIVQRCNKQLFAFARIIGKNPELELLSKSLFSDSEIIRKLIEELPGPQVKEDHIEKVRKTELENLSLLNELKIRDNLIFKLKSNIESLSSEAKGFKAKNVEYLKTIDMQNIQLQEILSENKRMADKEWADKRSINRTSDISDKSYSIRIERNLDIVRCCNICIINVYKNENLIRELRKLLKNKEKECFDKDSLLQIYCKKTCDQSTGTEIWTPDQEPFPSLQHQLKTSKKSQSHEIKTQNLHITKPIHLKITAKVESILEIGSLTSKNKLLLLKLEKLEKEQKDQESLSQFYKEKSQFYETEISDLSSQLKNHEEASAEQESQIRSLMKSKEELDQWSSKSLSLVSIKSAESCFSRVKSSLEESLNTLLQQIKISTSSLTQRVLKISKNTQVLATKQKLLKQSLQISNKSLSLRLEDREKSIETLNRSLKLAESSILSYAAIKNELEKEKESLSADKSQLITQISSLTQQMQNRKLENQPSQIEKLTDLIKSLEQSKESLQNTLNEKEELIHSLSKKNNGLETSLESLQKTLDLQVSKSKTESLSLSNKITVLEQQVKSFDLKNTDEEIQKIKSVYQSQVLILDNEIKNLEEDLRKNEEKLRKNEEELKKKEESHSNEINSLKSQIEESIQLPKDLKNSEFDILRCVKYESSTWYLVFLKAKQKFIWTDQDFGLCIKDELETIKEKHSKLKTLFFKLREENKKLLKILDQKKKESSDEIELTSPFISPRDLEVQQIYENLRTSGVNFTEYEEDTFGELSSKIIREGNSIFDASSFEFFREESMKVNLMLEKMNYELEEKNQIIKNYEKTLRDLSLKS